jgi:hypothetical protein
MNNRYTRVPTRFGTETRFEVGLGSPAPFRASEPELERLKNELLLERSAALVEPKSERYLTRAASEAAALAWVTAYPLLVFPSLFEEKADAALAQFERQEQIRQRSLEWLVV